MSISTRMIDNPVIYFSVTAIFTAVVAVVTMFFIIPIPATNGYFNLGDTMVMLAGFLLGPLGGAIAGAVGSTISDMFLAPIYAPATFIIKGLEGFIVGYIANPKKIYKKFQARDVIATAIAGTEMVLGYFIYEIILYGIAPALVEIPMNIMQAVIAIIVAIASITTLRVSLGDLLQSDNTE